MKSSLSRGQVDRHVQSDTTFTRVKWCIFYGVMHVRMGEPNQTDLIQTTLDASTEREFENIVSESLFVITFTQLNKTISFLDSNLKISQG